MEFLDNPEHPNNLLQQCTVAFNTLWSSLGRISCLYLEVSICFFSKTLAQNFWKYRMTYNIPDVSKPCLLVFIIPANYENLKLIILDFIV